MGWGLGECAFGNEDEEVEEGLGGGDVWGLVFWRRGLNFIVSSNYVFIGTYALNAV